MLLLGKWAPFCFPDIEAMGVYFGGVLGQFLKWKSRSSQKNIVVEMFLNAPLSFRQSTATPASADVMVWNSPIQPAEPRVVLVVVVSSSWPGSSK